MSTRARALATVGLVLLITVLGVAAAYASSDVSVRLPINTGLSQGSMPEVASSIGAPQQDISSTGLDLSYSSLTGDVTGSVSLPSGPRAITLTSVWHTTLSTSFGTMDYVIATGTLTTGGRYTNVAIDAQFVPGTDDAQAVMTIGGLGQPVHIVWGTPFVDAATMEQMNAAVGAQGN